MQYHNTIKHERRCTLPLIFTNPLSRDVTQDTSMSYGYVNIQSDSFYLFQFQAKYQDYAMRLLRSWVQEGQRLRR